MRTSLLSIAFLSIAMLPARAVIFYTTGDPAYNREVAPTGLLADSGWQYQGYFGSFLGTAISPKHFITAAHVGTSPTFVSKSFFNGGPSDVTYTVDATFNGGTGFQTISGTDLRVYQITGTFPAYAPLYTKTDEIGRDLVVFGRGTTRGDPVVVGGDLKGWRWGSFTSEARWGTNTVSAASTLDKGDMIVANFDAGAGANEAHLSVGDSGGAVFINDGGVWKLAGINYAVDGRFDIDGIVDGDEFDAALFDMGGLYVGSGTSWSLIDDEVADIPSAFYSSRISSYASSIYSIPEVGALIPEPGTVALLLPACALFLRRKRSRPEIAAAR